MRHHAKGAHLSRYTCWNYYLKTEPTICSYNKSKNFEHSETIFQHVSAGATAIIREVQFCEPKHCCCKLSVLCTHTFTLCPHQHRACWDAPCVDGDTEWICECMTRQTGSLQRRCFDSQRWTSLKIVVSANETCWNIVWLYRKFFELLYMNIVGLVFR